MGKWRQEIHQRWSLGRKLYPWGWRWVVGIIWSTPFALIGVYDTAIGQGFLPSNFPKVGATLSNWNPDWLYIWLLFGAILFIIFTFEGVYRLTYRNPSLKIDIHDSKSESLISAIDKNWATFEVAYVLKTNIPPVEIGRVQLHLQNEKLRSLEGSFTLKDKIQSCVARFEAPDDYEDSPERLDEKYRLSVFALGSEWESEEFTLTDRIATYQTPIENIERLLEKITPEQIEQVKKSFADKGDSQT